MTNRLANETSPYLLQHADNPVDWFPWGEAAFAAAKAANKPILLSVGYAACHWCHVMAHESFEDADTAALMNDLFVNVKVDREERPDIDNIYMTAVQAMTGGGGWPMTVFLTPDGTPYYGGTYFPPTPRHQLPSFRQVLQAMSDIFHTRPADVSQAGTELLGRMRDAASMVLPQSELSPLLLDDAYATLHGQFDPTNGGFGGAPKFPQAVTYEFLLRYARRANRPLAWTMLTTTLRKMAEGGMYDQLGGGFHRYSVDATWLVPHFEKMLYDNALLARVYTEVHQATGELFYRRIAEETLDYLLREMRHPDGGFFSTQDADSLETPGSSHKEEGAFFVWTPAEVRDALGPDAMAFSALYDVTDRGNFEGKNILHVVRQPEEVARVLGQTGERIEDLAAQSRKTLFALREQRAKPDRDEKILTAWNGMALRAFAIASSVFGRADYHEAAVACGWFALRSLRRDDGTLIRSWKDGRAGTTPGFLEDYALLADGFLALYDATLDPQWLHAAHDLAERILALFWDDTIQGFYDTASTHEALVVRPRDTGDNATPCGNSSAADVLLHLAVLLDNQTYRDRALAVLGGVAQFFGRYPTGFGRYLAATEFALSATQEIVIIGDPDAADTRALLDVVRSRFLPNTVLLLQPPEADPVITSPLLEGRGQIDGKATAYVCQNYACQLPVTTPEALADQLA